MYFSNGPTQSFQEFSLLIFIDTYKAKCSLPVCGQFVTFVPSMYLTICVLRTLALIAEPLSFQCQLTRHLSMLVCNWWCSVFMGLPLDLTLGIFVDFTFDHKRLTLDFSSLAPSAPCCYSHLEYMNISRFSSIGMKNSESRLQVDVISGFPR